MVKGGATSRGHVPEEKRNHGIPSPKILIVFLA